MVADLSPEALSLSWYNQNDDMYRIPCVEQQQRSIPSNDNAIAVPLTSADHSLVT
jgi:hypothetical protein